MSGLITVFVPSIAKASRQVETLAYRAGQDYVSKFYSQTVNEPRSIYPEKLFRMSIAYMCDGNWSKAIQLLEPLVNFPDTKIANRAKENLTVAMEAAELKEN